jgi:hypothetical protein
MAPKDGEGGRTVDQELVATARRWGRWKWPLIAMALAMSTLGGTMLVGTGNRLLDWIWTRTDPDPSGPDDVSRWIPDITHRFQVPAGTLFFSKASFKAVREGCVQLLQHRPDLKGRVGFVRRSEWDDWRRGARFPEWDYVRLVHEEPDQSTPPEWDEVDAYNGTRVVSQHREEEAVRVIPDRNRMESGEPITVPFLVKSP